jgi:hypothetical protein
MNVVRHKPAVVVRECDTLLLPNRVSSLHHAGFKRAISGHFLEREVDVDLTVCLHKDIS